MQKLASQRNHTLILTESCRQLFADRLLSLDREVGVEQILDRTICQDLNEAIDFLPDSFVDLMIVDPPYNLSKNFDACHFRRTDNESYTDYLRDWLVRLKRLLKPDASLYVCCDWRSSSAVFEVLSELLTVRNRITWQREKGRGANDNWKNSMEDIWYAVCDKHNFRFDLQSVKQKRRVLAPYKVDGRPKDWQQSDEGKFRLTCPSNFWDDITVPYWSMPENTPHPTQKPEKLIAKLILASCEVGGVVFDPFLGSGTTSVVARKLSRHYCGVELNSDYALLAEWRLDMANTDRSIQGYSDGVFWERNTSLSQLAARKNDK